MKFFEEMFPAGQFTGCLFGTQSSKQRRLQPAGFRERASQVI